jgi:Zn-dependent protease with chaperone function
MHLFLCFGSVIFALFCRLVFPLSSFSFLVAPLLFVSTTIVVLLMGCNGEMWMMPVGWLGFAMSFLFLVFCLLSLFCHCRDLVRSVQKTKELPLHVYQLKERRICFRLLDHDLPFAGLVGLVNPQLVLSRGLLDLLDQDHIEAVVCHEEAHRFYRDNFWFFWWNYLKQITAWLPRTEKLWQHLLLERELRADRKAGEKVDPLDIAEALLQIIQQGNGLIVGGAVPFFEQERLEQRIDALLSPRPQGFNRREILLSILVALLPLFYLPFHYQNYV